MSPWKLRARDVVNGTARTIERAGEAIVPHPKRAIIARGRGCPGGIGGCKAEPAHMFGVVLAGTVNDQERTMLGWALVFLIVAVIAGVFGFGGIASASAGIAKILFVIFLVLLLASLIAHVVRGRRPPL